ncbi:hypothetical protein LZ32DRAFT_133114 [Colletotrichum eremochloae]|nr:hypothetical protein LZ32DRAFT_133114 [Colletotrichum eremochloae]
MSECGRMEDIHRVLRMSGGNGHRESDRESPSWEASRSKIFITCPYWERENSAAKGTCISRSRKKKTNLLQKARKSRHGRGPDTYYTHEQGNMDGSLRIVARHQETSVLPTFVRLRDYVPVIKTDGYQNLIRHLGREVAQSLSENQNLASLLSHRDGAKVVCTFEGFSYTGGIECVNSRSELSFVVVVVDKEMKPLTFRPCLKRIVKKK